MDPVKILPTEIIENILSYLCLDDLLACCLVSEKWNIAANNDTLWKRLCLKNGWTDCSSLKKHANCFNFFNTDNLKDAFSNLGEWKKHFVLKHQLQQNWRTGNCIDHTIHPLKYFDDISDVGNISSVSSDGHNLVAFGFSKGMLSLFDLKNNCSNLLLNRQCPIISPVDYIEIINEFLLLIQENLLQIYKLKNDTLELFKIKLVNTSSVTDVDLEMDPISGTTLIRESRERCDDNVLYHFNKSHLVISTFFSNKIYVHNKNSDFIEPNVVFNTKDMEIDFTNKFILNLHCNSDILYILLSVDNYSYSEDEEKFGVGKFSIHAFCIKSKCLLFSNNVVNNSYVCKSSVCTMETNDRYLVLRFETNFFFIFDRISGKLIRNDRGVIFLNANSNPSLIGICLNISFQIQDPTNGSCYFCFTLDGSPISMYSNVLITAAVEYDGDGNGTTAIEFWNMYDTYEMINALVFPKNPNVILVYKDDTKVLFYAKRDHVVVRSFLA